MTLMLCFECFGKEICKMMCRGNVVDLDFAVVNVVSLIFIRFSSEFWRPD